MLNKKGLESREMCLLLRGLKRRKVVLHEPVTTASILLFHVVLVRSFLFMRAISREAHTTCTFPNDELVSIALFGKSLRLQVVHWMKHFKIIEF